MPPITYSVDEAADRMGAPSERWVVEQIRRGRFPARKIGRTSRMTEQDISDALDACLNKRDCPGEATQRGSGLTPTGSRILAATQDRSLA